jgi:hypothetical protein
MDNGSQAAIIVEFCDRSIRPCGGEMGVAGSRSIASAIGAASAMHPYASGSNDRRGQPARVTSRNCRSLPNVPLIGGEKFTIVHPTWGERVYEVVSDRGTT